MHSEVGYPVVIELDSTGFWWGWPVCGGRRVGGISVRSVRRTLERQLRDEFGIDDTSTVRLHIDYRLPVDVPVGTADGGADGKGVVVRTGQLDKDLVERILVSRAPLGRGDIEEVLGITSADLDEFFRKRHSDEP